MTEVKNPVCGAPFPHCDKKSFTIFIDHAVNGLASYAKKLGSFFFIFLGL